MRVLVYFSVLIFLISAEVGAAEALLHVRKTEKELLSFENDDTQLSGFIKTLLSYHNVNQSMYSFSGMHQCHISVIAFGAKIKNAGKYCCPAGFMYEFEVQPDKEVNS
jgi:hypothetical protein